MGHGELCHLQSGRVRESNWERHWQVPRVFYDLNDGRQRASTPRLSIAVNDQVNGRIANTLTVHYCIV